MDTYPRNQNGDILLTDKTTLYSYTAAVLNISPQTIDPRHYHFTPRDHQTVYLGYRNETFAIADRRALSTIASITGKPCLRYRDYLKKYNICDQFDLFLLLVILFCIAFVLSLPLFA